MTTNDIDISNVDFSKVESVELVFQKCSVFNPAPDIDFSKCKVLSKEEVIGILSSLSRDTQKTLCEILGF